MKRISPAYTNSARVGDAAVTLRVFEDAGMSTNMAVKIPGTTPACHITILENCKAIRVFQLPTLPNDEFAIAEK